MKLKVLEQIHVSAISSDSLRRGQLVEVSDSSGQELLQRHPDKFEAVRDKGASKDARTPRNKQAAAPDNKSSS